MCEAKTSQWRPQSPVALSALNLDSEMDQSLLKRVPKLMMATNPVEFIPRRSARKRKESPNSSTVQTTVPSGKKTCSTRKQSAIISGKKGKTDKRGSKSKIAHTSSTAPREEREEGIGPGRPPCSAGYRYGRRTRWRPTPEQQPLEATGKKLLGALAAVAHSAMDCEARSRPITDVHSLLRDICAGASPLSYPRNGGFNGNPGVEKSFSSVLLKIEGAQRLQGMAELMYYVGVMEFALRVNSMSVTSEPLYPAIREVTKRSVSSSAVLSEIMKAGGNETRSLSSLRRYLNDGTRISALASAGSIYLVVILACCRVKNDLKNLASDSVMRLARMIACPPSTATLVGRTIRHYLIPSIIYLQVRYPIKLSGVLSMDCLLDLGFTWTAGC
ncbi:hypothetical protein DFP72DRAFT_844091, partial [Ephemerocybe angulata]